MWVIKWFVIPWIIFGLTIYLTTTVYFKKGTELKPYIDLSNVSLDDLIDMDLKRAKSEGVTIKDNFPALYKGKKPAGILLIHGFTASPYEMKFLAEYLNRNGFYVYNARIAGHGSDPKNLNRLSYSDWYESLKYPYFALKKVTDKLVIIGQSMGALLALNISALNGADKVILLSPAVGIKDYKFKLVPLMQYVINFVKKDNLEDKYNNYYYNVRPVKGLYQLYLLIEYTWNNIDRFNFPIYMIQSKHDDIIDLKKVREFYSLLPSTKKKIDLLDQKDINHVLTLPDYKNYTDIFDKIKTYIEE